MMKLWAAVLLLTLTACATTYNPFETTNLAPDRMLITYTGDEFDTPHYAIDQTLLLAALMTWSKGYSHFLMADAGSSHETVSYSLRSYGTHSQPYSYTVESITPDRRVTVRVVITMLATLPEGYRPPEGHALFDAAFVWAAIVPKYAPKDD